MADQNITALPATTSPASSDQLLLVGTAEEKLINYDKLADAILTKLTSKKFTLNQGTETLLQALNELNSKNIRETIIETTTLEEYRVANGKLPGEYKINGVIISGISTAKIWGVLILSAAFDTQIVITSDGAMYIRTCTGNPAAWHK